MVAMTTASYTSLPWGRPLTHADLDRMPDDGHRYELVDGVLLVTPAPSVRHQRVVGSLYLLLRAACPGHLEVFFAPLDVVLAADTVMQPDILVARRADLSARDLPIAPVLAVEVLSPSTARVDRTLKKARLEAAGCGSYWVVDPAEPSLTAWDLVDGEYEQRASVTGEQTYTATRPFGVTVTPASLVN